MSGDDGRVEHVDLTVDLAPLADEVWTDSAAASLVGQRPLMPDLGDNVRGEVTAARLRPDGAVEVTVRLPVRLPRDSASLGVGDDSGWSIGPARQAMVAPPGTEPGAPGWRPLPGVEPTGG